VKRSIHAEPDTSEVALADQINALLGYADAPNFLQYRILQLLILSEVDT
jgi:hypothetical protein